MLTPRQKKVRLMKEFRKPLEGNPLAKWESASQWLTRFEDDRIYIPPKITQCQG